MQTERVSTYLYLKAPSLEMLQIHFLIHSVEATVPKITTSNATVSWYNREPRVLPVGGTIEVLSGTKVTLTCKYSAFPEAEVQWSVLGEEGQVLEQDVGNEVTNGSLVLMALQPSDSAEYVCSVRNVAGTAQASTALKILGECCLSCISHLLVTFGFHSRCNALIIWEDLG